jgi:hypothetical protein
MNVNTGSREIWHVELATERAFLGFHLCTSHKPGYSSACLLASFIEMETTALKMLVYGGDTRVQSHIFFPDMMTFSAAFCRS